MLANKELAHQSELDDERSRMVVSYATEALILQYKSGEIAIWNQAAERIFGLTKAEVLGQTSTSRHWETYREDGTHLPGAEHPSMHTLASGEPCHDVVLKVVRDDNTYSWVSIDTNPVFFNDQSQEPDAVAITVQDITNRKAAASALLHNQKRFKIAQAMGHLGNWEFDPITMKFWGSDEAKRIYGFELDNEDFTTDKVESCIPERERVHQALIDLIEEDKKYDLEFDILTHDKGIHKTIHSVAELERDAQDNPVKITGVVSDITKRKQAEELLLTNQYYLTKAQEIGKIGTWELDLLKNELIWTEQNYLNFGVPIGTALTYEIFLDCVHPDDRDYVNEAWSQAVNGQEYDIEHRVLAGGQVKWLREKADFTFDKNGKAIKAIGFTQDITDRKRAQRDLERSEGKYRNLVETASDAIYLMNEEGIIIDTNQSACELLGKAQDEIVGLSIDLIDPNYPLDKSMIENIGDVIAIVGADGMTKYQSPNIEKWFGWKPEDLIGTNGWDKMHPEDIERIQKEFSKMLKKETASIVEYRFKCKDGNYKWIELTAVNRINDPAINGVLLNYHDITERKQAEEELRTSEEKFRLLHENAGLGIGYFSAEGIVYSFNSIAAKDMNGVPEDFAGKSLFDLFPKELADSYLNRLQRAISTDEISVYEDFVPLPSQGKWFLSTYTKIINSEGKLIGIQIISQDITELKQAEENLRRSEKKFRALFENNKSINAPDRTNLWPNRGCEPGCQLFLWMEP